uniref:transglutaminase domain-containing protein n=1 Tax=uncultured Eubacterium sp. TaxID=165185 RepID=UPI0032677CB4
MSESVNKVKSKKETAESLKNILEYVSELKKSVTDEMNKAQKYAKEENLKTVLNRVEESRKEVSKDFADTENDINRVIKLCDKKDVSNKELDNEYANLTDEVRKITENEDIETKVPDKPHQTSKSYDVSESVGKQTPDSSLYTTSLLKKIENGECDGESTQDEALILSDEAKKIADTLNTPYEIYKYVKDTVDFKPYYGLRYGATGTFTCKVGNDYDTASLLIAMLKYRGFEARYVVGTVQIEIKEAINLTGADNEQGAVDILSMLGIPTTVVKTDGKITAVRIEHVWVEAYIPYDSYRGSGKVAGAKEWIPMDASYKKYEKQEKLNYDSDFNEEIKKLSEELKNENATGFSENLESIQDRITEYANEESIETDTIFSKRKIKEDTLSLLPSVLPYEVIKENAVFDRAPEKAKAKITFKLTTPFYGTYAIGDSDKEVTFEAASLYGKNVWIEYIPETDEDEKIIEKYGDIYSTPAYLIKVIPCIMADGECVAKGKAVRPGTYTIFGMDIYEAGCETVSVDNPLVAGGSYAVSFDYGKISEADLSDAKTELLSLKEKLESGKESNDRAMGETLSGIGTTYFAQLDMADSMLEGILNVTTWRQISEGIFGYKPKVTSIFGAPIGLSEGTVFVDIDTDTYGVADNGDKIRTSEVNNDQENEKDSNGDKENKVDHNPVRDFMLYSGFVGSYLESFVLEETVGVFAVSTMEVFKVALSRGMELVKIDSQNSDGFEKIKADDKTLSEMKNAVKAGRTIIVPKEEMCYYGWKGTAYIALDTSTGEGAYMISGSMCGGSTAINIIVGTINVIIAAYDLIAAIDMIILGLANPVLLTVALVFLGVAVYAYIDSMFTLFMYCSTGEERYGEEMMTNLYFNVTFGVITKVAGTLGKKVVRKIGDTLVEMGVDSKYVKNFFTEEFGGVSWDDSPGTGGSGNHGSGSGSHGTGEIPGGGSGNHGSGGTGSGSGSHGTGYIPGGGSPDYWNFIDAWELISKKYGEKVASILQEFGEDGLKLAEKYGD